MPATSPAAWQHESRNMSGKLARTVADRLVSALMARNEPRNKFHGSWRLDNGTRLKPVVERPLWKWAPSVRQKP